MPPLEFILPDMTCQHCERTVTRTIQQVDASAKVEIDLPSHRVRVDTALPASAFTRALAEEGYPPAPAP